MKLGGPEMAPQTPQRSERPGDAVALLYEGEGCPTPSGAAPVAADARRS